MVHAPFHLSNGSFNLAQHLAAAVADGSAQLCQCIEGVPLQHLLKILAEELRIQSAALLKAVGDAGGSGTPEGVPDAVHIIFGKRGIVHAVADILKVLLPVLLGKRDRHLLQLLGHHVCTRSILCFQHVMDSIHMRILQYPCLHMPGILPGTGIGHIEHIPQVQAVFTGGQQGDALGSAPDITVHGVVPGVKAGAGGGVWSLCVDQELIGKGILVQPGSCGEKGCLVQIIPGDLPGRLIRLLGIDLCFRGHGIPSLPCYTILFLNIFKKNNGMCYNENGDEK